MIKSRSHDGCCIIFTEVDKFIQFSNPVVSLLVLFSAHSDYFIRVYMYEHFGSNIGCMCKQANSKHLSKVIFLAWSLCVKDASF